MAMRQLGAPKRGGWRRGRRLLCLALALGLLLLAACAPEPAEEELPDPLPQELRVREDILYPYYSMQNPYDYRGGANRYGLLNAQGEFVLEQEYNYIDKVYGYGDTGDRGSVELERPYYFASVYGELTEQQRVQAAQEGWYDMPLYYALVSPDGELLTGFDYDFINLAKAGAPHPFVALHPDGTFVWLDEAGRELPLEDAATLEELRDIYRYTFSTWEDYMRRQGPDVPEDGFDEVTELPDGRYWGGKGYWDEGAEIEYLFETRLYSAGGELLSDRVYNSIVSLGDGLYMASLFGGMSLDDPEDRCYLTDESGIPVNQEVYDQVWYYALDAYLAVRQGEDILVLDRATLTEQSRFQAPMDATVWSYNQYGRICMSVSAEGEPPRLVFVDGEGGEIRLEGHPGCSIADTNADFTRFLLDPGYSGGKGEYYILLVDREGNELLRSDTSLFAVGDGELLVCTETREDDWSYYRYGLMDWDGEWILPTQFRELTVQDGHVLHVLRGDWTGLMDFGGNWIYRESIYQDIE